MQCSSLAHVSGKASAAIPSTMASVWETGRHTQTTSRAALIATRASRQSETARYSALDDHRKITRGRLPMIKHPANGMSFIV
jgi:hypothetical protein